MSHYSSTDVVERRPAGSDWPQRDSHNRPGMTVPEKCNCCPYGFHIDLGFVQYAEDVSNGNYQDHLKQVRRAKRKMRQSLENYQHQQPRVNGHEKPVDTTPSPLDRSGTFSPLDSIFSDSLENVMSDFDETYTNQQGRGRYRSEVEPNAFGRRAGMRTDGYQSDYGYAVPAQLRHQNGYGPPPSQPASILKRPTRLSLPEHRQTPPGLDRSGSFSSVNSLSRDKFAAPSYARGATISGQLARNMEGMANALPTNYSPAPARLSSATTMRLYGRSSHSLPPPTNRPASTTPFMERYAPAPVDRYHTPSRARNHMTTSLTHVNDHQDQMKTVQGRLSDRVVGLRQRNDQLAYELEQERQRLLSKPLPPPVPPKTTRVTTPATPDTSLVEEEVVEPKRAEYSTAVAKAMNEAKTRTLERAKTPVTQQTSTPSESSLSPPPAPPQRDAGVKLNPLIRTPSGNVLNVDGFHSIRRRDNSSSRSTSIDDYMSDSEVALGDRSFERYSSLRRSRTMLQGGARHLGGQWTPDAYVSDTEDYVPKGRPSLSSARRPHAVSSELTRGASNSELGSSEFFREQVSKWREQMQTLAPPRSPSVVSSVRSLSNQQSSSPVTTPLTPPVVVQRISSTQLSSAPPSTPPSTVRRKESGSMTEPPPVKLSKGVTARFEEQQKSQAHLEIKSGPCAQCEARKKGFGRTSVGVGTAPTPFPKPSHGCTECQKLRTELEERRAKKLMFTRETFTDGSQEVNRPSKSAMTDVKEKYSFGIMVDIPKPGPQLRTTATNTHTPKFEKFEIGVGTDKLATQDHNVGTDCVRTNDVQTSTAYEDLSLCGAVQNAAVGTEHSIDHIAIGTDAGVTGLSFRDSDKTNQFAMTDLDLDALLAELSASKFRAPSSVAAVNTEPICVSDVCCGSDASPTAVEAGTNTSIASSVERGSATDAVQVRPCVESKALAVQTDQIGRRSVFVNTEAAPTPVKATAKSRDTGSNPIRWPQEKPKQTCDVEIQAQIGLSRSEETRSEMEEVDELWLMPQPVDSYSVACGEDSVHGQLCDHCQRLQYSFTRNVGVGTCAVSDRMCVSCDVLEYETEQLSIDESEAPGLSYQTSPAFVRHEQRRSSAKRNSIEEVNGNLNSSPEQENEQSEESPEPEPDTPVAPPRRKVDLTKPRGTRAFELSRAAATKKLLTSEQKQQPGKSPFARGTAVSKSMRAESRKGDSLAYITDKKGTTPKKQGPSPPTPKKGEGLKGKVSIKKEIAKPVAKNPPPPVPAKIPRPKYAKYASPEPVTQIQTSPEEVAEAEDRLTPLRSEMIVSWPGSPVLSRPRPVTGGYDNPVALDSVGEIHAKEGGRLVGQIVDNLPARGSDESSSDSDSLEEGSYSADGQVSATCDIEQPNVSQMNPQTFELTTPLQDACTYLNKHLTEKETNAPEDKVIWAQQYLQHEWLKASARRHANAHFVEAFLDALEGFSKELLHKVVNLADQNDNTALHYAVSHGNFDVVSLLLDAKVVELNRANKAGYTPIMLAALCPVTTETETMVIQRLFQMGDVNVKASQHGQTALMLAVSHGKLETAQLLVNAGAGLNIQDEDGSTALMCAAEHGHKDIVRFLLAQPDIDASITDYDDSTALSIAVENGHRDVGVLIYAHLNYGRGVAASSKSAESPTSTSPSASSSST